LQNKILNSYVAATCGAFVLRARKNQHQVDPIHSFGDKF